MKVYLSKRVVITAVGVILILILTIPQQFASADNSNNSNSTDKNLVGETANIQNINQNKNQPFTKIKVGEKTINAEIANNPKARQKGLMFRKEMSDETGMLFVFPNSADRCFWMKNTLLPLTAIFIDESYKIINSVNMKPLDESSYCSHSPAKYVLEVKQGWLKKYNLEKINEVEINKQFFAW